MSKNPKGSHLTLSDRIFIEKSLNEHKRFNEIAHSLCKDPSTISKEIIRFMDEKPLIHYNSNCAYSVSFFAISDTLATCQPLFQQSQSHSFYLSAYLQPHNTLSVAGNSSSIKFSLLFPVPDSLSTYHQAFSELSPAPT